MTMNNNNPLTYPILFSNPQRLTANSYWYEDIPFAMLLVSLTRPQNMVELGLHYGESDGPFCQAIAELKLDCRCYAIDNRAGDIRYKQGELETLEDLRKHHDQLNGGFSVLINSDLNNALPRFIDGTVDLLHIDGAYTYEAIKNDFTNFLPKMSKRGIALLHNINVMENVSGARLFFNELKPQFPNFEFLHGRGFGVLFVGDSVPESIKWLFEMSGEESQAIKNLFFTLGQRLTCQTDMVNRDRELEQAKKQMQYQEQSLLRLGREIEEKDRQISDLSKTLFITDPYQIAGSRAWKLTQIIWAARRKLIPHNSRREKLAIRVIRLAKKLSDHRKTKLVSNQKITYQQWINENEPGESNLESQMDECNAFSYQPLISIIVPIFNTPPKMLEAMLRSVASQTYRNWQLCLVDGNSNNHIVREILDEWRKRDRRVVIKLLDENLGISGNSNEALALAKGEFVALLDHDDLLAPFALYEVVKLLNLHPDTDFIYSDRDSVDEEGIERSNPLFKPDWSPEIMLSANYLTHLCVFRKLIIDEIGGFRSGYDGAQDWDLFLRITEKTGRIRHIPKILYHWRMWGNSTALTTASKPYAIDAQVQTITDYLKRKGINAKTTITPNGLLRVSWPVNDNPKVSIIIPTTGRKELIEPCLKSLLNETSYRNFEVIVIHNGNLDESHKSYYHNISQQSDLIKVIYYDKPFNYSSVNNLGVKVASGNILLFLNDDTEILNGEWLEEMVQWIQHPEIGVVGAKLVTPEGKIQHAGIILGLTGLAGHIFSGFPPMHLDIFGHADWYRNYLAVTGACLMIRRTDFEEIGGFDEQFSLCGSDVELCLRIIDKGLRVLYTPFAILKHLESATHQRVIPKNDFILSRHKYGKYLLSGDPFFNPNLSLWSTLPTFKAKTEEKIESFLGHFLQNLDKENIQVRSRYQKPISETQSIVSWYDCTKRDIEVSKKTHKTYKGEIKIKSINWFIPEFTHVYYGGIYTILCFANYLKERKQISSRFNIVTGLREFDANKIISMAFPSLSNSSTRLLNNYKDLSGIPYADASIATLWTTAYYLLKFNNTKRKFYFIQDCEPLFYQAGSVSAQVEATYRFGFYGLTNTITLKDIYQAEYEGVAEYFTPCVNTRIFHPGNRFHSDIVRPDRLKVFFYGRPGHARNAFELGIAALTNLKNRLGDKVQIVSAGAEWLPSDWGLERIVENLGLLSYEDTAALYRTCDVGLVMMLTRHPSYLPFELMASGCMVVSNRNKSTGWFLRDGENCLLAETTAGCIADVMEQSLADDNQRRRIAANALDQIQQKHTNWDEQFEKIFRFMCAPGSSSE